MATVLVELERHDRDPGAGQGERGALLRHSAPQHQPTDPCTTLVCVSICRNQRGKNVRASVWSAATDTIPLLVRPTLACKAVRLPYSIRTASSAVSRNSRPA